MTVIRSQFTDLATGLPRAGVYVYARLVGPASWLTDHQGQMVGTYEATSGADGWYSLSLPPQATYEVSGTYYAVEEWGNTTWTVSVPDSDTPVLLRDCLVDPPPETNPFSPISTFDTLRDVNPAGRDAGDILVVGEDGKIGYAPKSSATAAPNWYQGQGAPPNVIPGSSAHDIYVDTLTGTFYILE